MSVFCPMKTIYSIAVGALLLLFAFSGCNKQPNGGVPIYMRIDSVRVKIGAGQGQAIAHNVTDIWVEANTDNVGAYSLPRNFPVLQAGDVRFVLSAGVKESGQSGVRVIYPFYTTDTFTLTDAVPGMQYSHTPVFTYVEAATFTFNDDFNSGSVFTGDSIVYLNGNNRCATLTVTAADSAKTMLATATPLPAGQEIWLEFDYKAEVPFYVGFYGNFTGLAPIRAPVLFLNPKEEWNHSYVKLSNYVGEAKAETYNIFFEALRPFGSPGGTVYIDNVKLVHF